MFSDGATLNSQLSHPTDTEWPVHSMQRPVITYDYATVKWPWHAGKHRDHIENYANRQCELAPFDCYYISRKSYGEKRHQTHQKVAWWRVPMARLPFGFYSLHSERLSIEWTRRWSQINWLARIMNKWMVRSVSFRLDSSLLIECRCIRGPVA